MRSEEEIKALKAELEKFDHPEEDSYLDEGQQAELAILNWILGDDGAL